MIMEDTTMTPNEVAGANRRWRLQFRCRGSRRESAVAQLYVEVVRARAVSRLVLAGGGA
jgi:hypothetical protein